MQAKSIQARLAAFAAAALLTFGVVALVSDYALPEGGQAAPTVMAAATTTAARWHIAAATTARAGSPPAADAYLRQ